MPDPTPKSLDVIAEDYQNRIPEGLRDTLTFDEYLQDEVYGNPLVTRNAHQRLADMFEYFGTEYDEETGIVEYKLATEDSFHDGENRFFGREVHEAIHEFVNKIYSGSRGLGPENRIKLLLGPVGSGKSHFDQMVRQYFEEYTRRDAGKMFTFRWTNLCDVIDDQDPSDDVVRSAMNQDPLTLLPREERNDVFNDINDIADVDYELANDQSLDPLSEFFMDELMEHYNDNLQAVLDNHIEVIRLIANENRRRCIETFEPKDKKNQDETELTGDINYSKIAVYGESDPRSFEYSGAFCNANRGIFSGEELLKLQKEFLYDFLHATQEGTIKPRNNPRIDIDQVIVGRTNMPEYREKRGNEKMEAFNDRTKRIDYPYVLEYSEEARIFEKMLNNASVPEVDVEPHTLEMAGLFSVLTRLDDPDTGQVNLLQKAKAYNGEDIGNVDAHKLRDEAEGEGLSGVSARFVGDEISEAIVTRLHDENQSLSTLAVMNHLEQNLESHGSIDEDNYEDYYNYIEEVRDEYEDRAIEDVRHALAYNTDEIREQGEKYMDHVVAYIDDDKIEDETTGEMVNPDEKFMRAVENELEIPEDRKDDFRQEISNWVTRRVRSGQEHDPTNNERLLRALERKNWADKKHNINYSALVNFGSSDSEEHSEWIEAMKERGYSEAGAKEALEFAGAKVAKDEMDN